MADSNLDLGLGDVHVPSATGKQKTMAESDLTVSAAQRKKMPAGEFGDPENKGYPLIDAAHVRNAAARLEQQKGSMSPAKYRSIRSRIARAARKFGVESEYNKKTNSSARTFSRGLRMTTVHADGSRTTIHHMSAFADEGGSLLRLSLPINKTEALGEEGKKVWVQIAKTGRWLGHRQGAFELNSRVFDQICSNFESQHVGRIQYDFEHASEQPPASGNIPTEGAPAHGWIYALKHDGQRLFALTEWLGLARQYIANDQYQGVSPAINWNQKDRVSGKPIGATLSSVALTNKPFLTEMVPPSLAASAANDTEQAAACFSALSIDDEYEATLNLSGNAMCYSMDEILPRIKSALRLHELCTPQDMSDAMSNLREHLDAAGGDHTRRVNGVRLSDYALPLRGIINAHAGMSWDEVFDVVDDMIDVAMDKHIIHVVDDMIDVAMDKHIIQDHGGEEETSDAPSLNSSAEATPAASTLTSTGGPEMAKTVQELELEITNLTGERNQLKVDLEAAEVTISTLSAKIEEHDMQLLSARVDEAFDTYKQKYGLPADAKSSMLSVAKASRDAFEKLYPKLPQPQRHLLTVHTGDGRTQAATQLRAQADSPSDQLPAMTPAQLVQNLMSTRKLSLAAAQCEADKILRRMRTAH